MAQAGSQQLRVVSLLPSATDTVGSLEVGVHPCGWAGARVHDCASGASRPALVAPLRTMV